MKKIAFISALFLAVACGQKPDPVVVVVKPTTFSVTGDGMTNSRSSTFTA